MPQPVDHSLRRFTWYPADSAGNLYVGLMNVVVTPAME